jgi:DNA primase
MFPIFRSGSVVNFYARSICDSDPKGLYGKAKGTISNSLFGFEKIDPLADVCYVTEGAFDVLAIQRALGSVNAVATDGPVIHREQAKLLKIFPKIVIVPDMKGKAKSIIPTARKYLGRTRLYVVEPPRGSDIDDWIAKDFQGARDALRHPALLRESKLTTVVNYTIKR